MPFLVPLLLVLIGTAEISQTAQNEEGKPATSVEVSEPKALAVFESFLYIADQPKGSIRRVDLKNGTISTVHPQGKLSSIDGMVADPGGNLIVCEFTAQRISKVNVQDGTIIRIAGGHGIGFSGDSGPATEARLRWPSSPTFDETGNLYFADITNHRIRRIDTQGIMTTVAGTGNRETSGDDGPARLAGLEYPNAIAIDKDGTILISQSGYGSDSHRIRTIDANTGLISTIAGLGGRGMGGDNGPALHAELESPSHVMFDLNRNILIVDPVNDRIRRIDARTLGISTIAGTTKGFWGDGELATAAKLNNPSSIAIDKQGNLYISDYANNRVRRVDVTRGVITTVAGNGNGTKVHIIL